MTNHNINKPPKLKKCKSISELDIYQFVNSKDIKYKFEPVCAAFII